MKKTNSRLLYLLPLLLTVTLIVFGEALGDLWKEDVKALFQQNKWLLLAFVGLLALVGFLWERQQRSEKPAPEAVDKDQYDEAFVQFRKNLLEQYQTRLASKTGRRLPVNLTAKSTHFGTAPERVEAYFKDKERTIESENIASEIDKILKTNARLLLIGDPGAGKTTILLYAAINILHDESEPKLPLILNLATWTKGRDFAEWYAQNIAHSYSLSPVFVQELLRRNAVVPFFDGFDEVAEYYRDDCFQKMAAYFGDEKRKQLIVSSRKKEYAAAKADAPVYAEIEVLPLSLAQIKMNLSENAESQAADHALLHALEQDKWLAEAVETPFYLNTASFLFGKGQRTLADFSFQADSTEGRQAELVEIFVAEQVPEEQDRKHLSFLAGKMRKWSFPVFELADMQPRWCKTLWLHSVSSGLVFGLVAGLIIVLASGRGENFIGGFSVGLVLGSFSSEIRTADVQIWRWRTFIKNWRRGLFYLLAVGIFFGLAGSSTGKLVVGLTIGLVIGLIAGLRVASVTTNYLLHIPSPYQRFSSTFQSSFGIVPTLLLALIFTGLAFDILVSRKSLEEVVIEIQNPALWSKFLSLGVLLLIIPIYISQLLQHFSLRLVLYLEGKMPLRVVTFMDRMTDQLIFEDNRRTDRKDKKMRGATWRFRHKILQDYFAGMDTGRR